MKLLHNVKKQWTMLNVQWCAEYILVAQVFPEDRISVSEVMKVTASTCDFLPPMQLGD